MLKIEKLVMLEIITFKHYISYSLNELSLSCEFNYIVQLEMPVPSLVTLCCCL